MGERGGIMVSVVWVTNIIGIFFILISSAIAFSIVIPVVRLLLKGITDNPRVINSVMSLFAILVYLLIITGIVDLLIGIGNKYLNYVSVIKPGLDLLWDLVPYVKWLILGIIIAIALKKN